VEYLQKLLDDIGLGARRLRMVNLSSAMGNQFATFTDEMAAEIDELGPNPLRINDQEIEDTNNL
jgi:coenzyme F420-reducing hydrogenase delta subunit